MKDEHVKPFLLLQIDNAYFRAKHQLAKYLRYPEGTSSLRILLWDKSTIIQHQEIEVLLQTHHIEQDA